MPYYVETLPIITGDTNDSQGARDAVQTWLNRKESEGYRLSAVLPEFRTWNPEGESEGWTSAMLVLQKDD